MSAPCPQCGYPIRNGVCSICVALERVRAARERARLERRVNIRRAQPFSVPTARLPYKDA